MSGKDKLEDNKLKKDEIKLLRGENQSLREQKELSLEEFDITLNNLKNEIYYISIDNSGKATIQRRYIKGKFGKYQKKDEPLKD